MAGGFFTQALVAAGAGLQGYERQQLADQQIQQNQQQIEMNKMAMLSQQKQQKAQDDVSEYMSTSLQKDKSIMDSPLKMADLTNKAAMQAAKDGDYTLMQKLAAEAKVYQNEYKEQLVELAQQKQQKADAASKSAIAFSEGDMDSPEARQDFAKSMMDAGVPMKEIPLPTDSAIKWKSFTAKMKMNAGVSAEQAKFIQEQKKEEDATNDRKAQIAREEKRDRADQADKAVLRNIEWTKAQAEILRASKEGSAGDPDKRMPMLKVQGDYEYTYDPKHKYKGDRLSDEENSVGNQYVRSGFRKLSQPENTGISRSLTQAGEIARGLSNMESFQGEIAPGVDGASLTPFAHLDNKSFMGALLKMGTQTMTPDQTVAYSKAVSGLGIEVGNLLSAMGGRTPNLSTMVELQNMSARESGMSAIVGLYGIANTADIARTYLKNLPLAKDTPKIQEAIHALDKFPLPSEIAAKINEQALDKAGRKHFKKLQETVQKDRDAAIKQAQDAPLDKVGSGGGGALPPNIEEIK